MFFLGLVIESATLPIPLILEWCQLAIVIGNVIFSINFWLPMTKLPISINWYRHTFSFWVFTVVIRLTCCHRVKIRGRGWFCLFAFLWLTSVTPHCELLDGAFELFLELGQAREQQLHHVDENAFGWAAQQLGEACLEADLKAGLHDFADGGVGQVVADRTQH